MDRYVQSFSDPDELIELDTVRSAMITRSGITVSHDIQQPGWRWSTHIRPLVKTEWCEVRHLSVLVRGQLRVLLKDGTEFDAGPMSLMDIPAGHDAWVVGDEPVETIAWTSVREWLQPLDTLSERVLATLVFTDLVDSTGTAARLGRAAWGGLIANHELQGRNIVTRFPGTDSEDDRRRHPRNLRRRSAGCSLCDRAARCIGRTGARDGNRGPHRRGRRGRGRHPWHCHP